MWKICGDTKTIGFAKNRQAAGKTMFNNQAKEQDKIAVQFLNVLWATSHPFSRLLCPAG